MKTRRLLLILAAVLLICTSMVTAAYAVTDEDVADAEVIKVGDVLKIEEFSKENPKVYKFIPEEDAHYIFESSSEYDVDTFGEVYQKIDTDEYKDIAADDDSGDGDNFLVSFYAEKDKEYYLYARPYSGTITEPVSVSLIKDPVSQIAFQPYNISYNYIEYRGGYWAEDDHGNKYYRYRIPDVEDFSKGDKLILTISGTDVAYVYDAYKGAFINGEEEISANDLDTRDTQKDNHWTPEKDTNSFLLEYRSFTTIVPVTLTPSNITSISYTPVEDFIYFENDLGSGYWDYDKEKPEEKWFHYARPYRRNGDILTVKTTDNPYGIDYVYNSISEVYRAEGGDEIDESEVSIGDDQDVKHWYPDSDNYAPVSFANQTSQIKVLIKKSDVTAISYEPATPYQLVEGDDNYGTWGKDEKGNRVFKYEFPPIKKGDTLTITKTGENPAQYVYDDEREGFVHGDDFISYYSLSRKSKGEWAPGTGNKLEVTYLDQTCEVDVTILPNPVRSFTYTPVEDIIRVKGNDGDGYWYDDPDKGIMWIYSNPYFRAGDVLSVTTDDGTEDYVFDNVTHNFICGEKAIKDWQVYRTIIGDWAPGNNDLSVFFAGTEVKVPVTIYDEHKHDDSTIVSVPKVEPTCAAFGYEAHYDCSVCHQHFLKDADEGNYNKSTLYNIRIAKVDHKIVHADKKKATDKAAGNLEGWTCSVCGAWFSDEKGTTEIDKDKQIIPKNNMTVTAKKKQYTAKTKKKTVLKAKALYNVKNAKGKLTYKKANKAGKSKITVAKSGAITVKKGIKKGTYKVRVKVTSAATDKYRACVKYVTIKIKVK